MSLAIIGGSGFSKIDQFKSVKQHQIDTPYGSTSSPIIEGTLFGVEKVFFLPRHGDQHTIQPHLVNYRANIYALKQLAVNNIVALAAVGGIDENCQPGTVIVPEQILDYTYGREMTFYDQPGQVAHAEFTEPYSAQMRQIVLKAAEQHSIDLIKHGVYAVTQGPRFETAAEIKRYQRDGATLVGMTAMPEAVLARELGLAYMTLALSVNYAAGVKPGVIDHVDIHAAYGKAAEKVYAVLTACLQDLRDSKTDIPQLIQP